MHKQTPEAHNPFIFSVFDCRTGTLLTEFICESASKGPRTENKSGLSTQANPGREESIMTFIIGKGQSETPTGKDGQDPQIHQKKSIKKKSTYYPKVDL